MQAARQRDLVLRSRRAVRWLQPGLVVKRWLLTSGIGLMLALLGAAVWADLQPIYWMLWAIQESLSWITRVLPRGITGPLVLLVGVGLLLWGQSRSFGSIQQALERAHIGAIPGWLAVIMGTLLLIAFITLTLWAWAFQRADKTRMADYLDSEADGV